MQKELDVRIDGQHRVRSGTQAQASRSLVDVMHTDPANEVHLPATVQPELAGS